MKLRQILLLPLLIATALQQWSIAQLQPIYYARDFYLNGTASALYDGLLGFSNPANLKMLDGFNLRYYWQAEQTNAFDFDSWGFFSATPGLGFGMFRQHAGRDASKLTSTTYRFGHAEGNRSFGLGISYARTTGDLRLGGYKHRYSVGSIIRAHRVLSLGLVGNFADKDDWREGIVEAGVRPLGSRKLTIFGDAGLQKGQSIGDFNWSAGAALELIEGLQISGRYFDNEAYTVGLQVAFGKATFTVQSHYDDAGDRSFNTYSVGAGDWRGNLFSPLLRDKSYIELNMKGRVDYLKYQWFDSGTKRFMDILHNIEQAQNDPRVSVIAMSLSDMRVLPEHAWEIRQALQQFRQSGKKVVIFIDNAGMTNYHLASVADRVMMDPQGTLNLPGYRLGRTFLKGTLDKMGLAFDEWRFFEYKSAAEALSREKMSQADREQRQAMTDAFYETARSEISASRGISMEQFDHLINNHVYFLAKDALAQELVDTLCRWEDVGKVIKNLTGEGKMNLPLELMGEVNPDYDAWGEYPRIAVVYALGECAMDSGIRARWLGKALRKLGDNRSIDAIVMRVDSPGGDGMASDVVAEALRYCSQKKPVIVSQGQVAASGGYWISMYADTIVAAPTTITGSIGVIGGWIYDKGFSDKLGMTSDLVQRGEHADLGFGVTLPLLGITVPARNLTEEERGRAEQFIKSLYNDFVGKVADGRGMSTEAVEAVAQGRVWSGNTGKNNGLVDEVGGLQLAIEIARKMAKIPADRSHTIVEIPDSKGLLNLDFLSPVSLKKEMQADETIRFIKIMSERPGFPRPMLLPGEYPEIED